jgi:2C-methyl-D-erythritol 2,4-cyclodiphosphate synthase
MNTKHTQGPWKQVARAWIVADAGVVLTAQGDIKEADARMIAAAPDMLEALLTIEKSITEYLHERAGSVLLDWDFGEGFGGSIDTVRAAIAKATGEA